MSATPGSGLMPIGRLARLSRLTVKALRLYDAEGLLEPAWVDPESGYRYYRAAQVREATTIALLRSLGVPLATIGEVLRAPDGAALGAVLEAERQRAAAELAAREQALRSIERLARAPEAVRYDVAIAPQRTRRLAAVEGPCRADALGPDTAALCRRALELLPRSDDLLALFPLDLEPAFALTVGVVAPRPAAIPAGAVERELPAGEWASTLHVGPYDELPLAYAALLEHVRERGHDAAGPIVESYLSDPAVTPPTELVTRIAVLLS